ncbi:MAG TPA: type II toxin-antitoxin system prevent-host-death family antitoxin [Epsilonproteobacteria bacterium]|nr:type II toxin-antitoxin system prevent-host-death family antitoxin [Campylobacterota bacterium]
MIATAKDLRFKIAMLFDVLSKGEDVTITYRGKPRAKLVPADNLPEEKDDLMFGMWKDREEDVDQLVREMRRGRNFDL